MAQWKITDNSTGTPSVYTFPINPIEFDHPGRDANITDMATTGSVGGTILFQGRDKLPQLSFTGKITSATMYTNLRAELDKWYDVVLTDDQGAEWNIIIQSYTMKRLKSAVNHHRYEYSVTAKVVT